MGEWIEGSWHLQEETKAQEAEINHHDLIEMTHHEIQDQDQIGVDLQVDFPEIPDQGTTEEVLKGDLKEVLDQEVEIPDQAAEILEECTKSYAISVKVTVKFHFCQ
jgi:hypothetical protein